MQTTTTPYTRIAFHAHLGDVYGTAIRDTKGQVWFVATDTDRVQRLTMADWPALHLHGRVDLAAAQRLADVETGTDLARLDATRMAA